MQLDFSSQLHYLLAMLPETVLAVSAMVVLLVDVFQKGDRSEPSRPVITWLALAGVLLAGLANGWLLTLGEVGRTGMVPLDSFRVFTNYLFLLAAALFILISTRYLEQEHLRLGEIFVLVMLAVVGMMVFAGSRDLIVIFLGLELMSIPVYVLTGVNRRSPRAAEAALKYFLLGAFSSAIFLFGVALVYGGTGSVNIGIVAMMLGTEGLGASPLVPVGMTMLAVGFAFKVSAVPFHMWTPDAYEGAPAPVTGFMAAAVKAAAFVAFLRVFITAFPGLYDTWGIMIFWLAILTMVAANLVALTEPSVKRMLAYSSIAHAGYLLVALAAASTLGAAAFLFYLLVYTLMTLGVFGVVLLVGREGEAHVDLESYSGLAWRRPLLGVAMTVFLLSLAGFPLTGGFIGKVYILQAAVERDLLPLAIVLVLVSLVSYWYYLRVAWYMWFRESPTAEPERGLIMPQAMRVALIAAVAGLLLLGILPGAFLEVSERSAASLMAAPPTFFGLP
jgi:NADH-quinone oxidoreductase subunit N